ncbi:aldehyde dehydrogenase family protein [Pelomonas sp. SE-A7]|uniref:aldehyde dehydrogenase family protein n=1 Tax=Pelomonas sp. SE-A7 TaxID=3054953 RepID=UPI00259CADFD|nr:aldehyde dehydrogenase family protein [Pelomonas sp. SE-A7]MDM4764775.1 aldehyde dehydrogenase family protein [Pelomonas sp. SE-A7]
MSTEAAGAASTMRQVLALQRAALAREGTANEALRRDRLERAIGLLVDHRHDWCEALSTDFSSRHAAESLLVDVLIPLENLRHSIRHLRRWMRPERRASNFPFGLLGARSEIRWEPRGVVGNIVPWNIPALGLFGPLAPMLAAGNRVMLKMSEFAPASAALAERLIGAAFDLEEVAVFSGDATAGAAFAALPLDHLMFTGSTRVGRMVMRAASENLTPVTLELGGKSPALVCQDADLELAARRIAWGKLVNGGQACIAPDYVLVPEALRDGFVELLRREMLRQFPQPLGEGGPTALVSEAHAERLRDCVDEARERGARIVPVCEGRPDTTRRIVPSLVVEPDDGCRLMREEIFGPLLPVKAYGSLDEAIAYVNARPHPLALYCFGGRAATERVVAGTRSGGVAINDVISHGMQENLPFGGVGESGMGAFHAEFGFRAFSHPRAVYRAPRLDPLALLRPPFVPASVPRIERLLRLRRG